MSPKLTMDKSKITYLANLKDLTISINPASNVWPSKSSGNVGKKKFGRTKNGIDQICLNKIWAR